MHSAIISFIAVLLGIIAFIGRLIGFEFNLFETDIIKLRHYVSKVPCVITGDLSQVKENTQHEFLRNMEVLANKLNINSLSPFSTVPASSLTTIQRALDASTRLRLQMRKKFIRHQPFGIIISGPPGSGKTHGLQSLCAHLYKEDHDKLDLDDMVILNEGDAFQSEFQNHHKIVIFDDLGATKTEFAKEEPFRKIIDFINNVPKTALNPNLDLKGSIWIEPDIVGATTNLPIPFVKNQQRNTDSMMCPDAVNRRFKLKLYQKGYDEFYIVDKGDEISSERNKLTFNQMLVIAKERYLAHVKEQKEYITMTEELFAESSSFNFALIIAFQQAVRISIGWLSTKEEFSSCGLLSMFRHFAQFDLQNLKTDARNEIRSRLLSLGYGNLEVKKMIDILERRYKNVTTLGILYFASDFKEIINIIISVCVNSTARNVEAVSLHYDLFTTIAPFIIRKSVDYCEDTSFGNWCKNQYYKLFNRFCQFKESFFPMNKAESFDRIAYLKDFLDFDYIEANLINDESFPIVVNEDGFEDNNGNIYMKRGSSRNFAGMTVSLCQYLLAKQAKFSLIAESRTYKLEPKKKKDKAKSKKEKSRTYDNTFEFHNQIVKTRFADVQLTYPACTAATIAQSFIEGGVRLTTYLTAQGCKRLKEFIVLPDCYIKDDMTIGQGALTLIYSVNQNILYILSPRDNRGIHKMVTRNLLDRFKGKCALMLVSHSVNEFVTYVAPLEHHDFPIMHQDFRKMMQYQSILPHLLKGQPRKGGYLNIFGTRVSLKDSPIRIEKVEEPRGHLDLHVSLEPVSESSETGVGEEDEIFTPYNLEK